MLYQDTPYSAKEEMFAQAKAVGASYIRLDLGLAAIFTRGEHRGHPFYRKNWTQTDQYAALANRYGVKILANLYATPWFIADCPAGTPRADAYRGTRIGPDPKGRLDSQVLKESLVPKALT